MSLLTKLKTLKTKVKSALKDTSDAKDNAIMADLLQTHLESRSEQEKKAGLPNSLKEQLQQTGTLTLYFEGVCRSMTAGAKESFVRRLTGLLYPKVLITFDPKDFSLAGGKPSFNYGAEKIELGLIACNINILDLLSSEQIVELLNIDGLHVKLDAQLATISGEVKKVVKANILVNHDDDSADYSLLHKKYPHVFLTNVFVQTY